MPLSSARQNKGTVFIFVTVSITSLYNGGLKNENFVVKIYPGVSKWAGTRYFYPPEIVVNFVDMISFLININQ
jgi:hypothetical protein